MEGVDTPAHQALACWLLVRQVQPGLTAKLGRPPRNDEVATETGLTPERVRAASAVPATVSLHAPIGETGVTLAEFVADDGILSAETAAELAETAAWLRQAVARLPERDNRIVTLRYGLADGEAQNEGICVAPEPSIRAASCAA